MGSGEPENVTLNTVHEDLRSGFADLKQEVRAGFEDLKGEMRAGFADLKGEMRTGFADLKVTLITGFQNLPTRESSEEMVRLLRESNRIQEERFTQLDVRIREQHLEIQQVLRALVEGVRNLATDIKALVARIDALIRGRGDGSPS
jgi:hypothetical protein